MKIYQTLILLLVLSVSAKAQKLPQTQNAGSWTPANIKIDGISSEWGNFQAYNKATNIWYTVSNDDKNLYLAVHATDPVIISKIATSGVSLNITVPQSKNTVAVTFPAYDKENKSLFGLMDHAAEVTTAGHIDTFVQSHNQLLATHQKIIRITRNDKDEDISVYNDAGVKAAGKLDNKLGYTLEMAIPLTYLDIKSNSFAYNITLNGQIPKGATTPNLGRPDIITYTSADGKAYIIGHATPENLILAYPTDLKATYTMAQK